MTKSSKLFIFCILIIILISIITILTANYLIKDEKTEGSLINNLTGELGTIKTVEEIEEEKSITLSFYDSKANCSLNGEVYINNGPLGKTKNGLFFLKLNETVLDNNVLEIRGITDDCFNKDENLPFLRSWNISSAGSNNQLYLETELEPRKPSNYYEIQAFVRPYETSDYISKINKSLDSNNIEANLDKINEYGIRYRSDNLLFNQEEYWQTPKETLVKGHGDCEDWAITSLSMIREYNSSLQCYNLLWESHLSIFCYVDGNYIIYDQDKTKFKTQLIKTESIDENKIRLRKMRNNYFEYYGLKPNERNIYAAFNEETLVVFNEQEDFIEWLLNIG